MFFSSLIIESPLLQADELCEKVRANVNIKRCIVVLREIPEATPIEVLLYSLLENVFLLSLGCISSSLKH